LKFIFKNSKVMVGVWALFCEDELGPLYVLFAKKKIIAKHYKWVFQTYFISFYKKIRRKYSDEVVMQKNNIL
jgi:hypothetical protein